MKDNGGKDIRKLLDEAIDIIDKIETFVSRIKPGQRVESGLVFQIYQNLMILREKIVEARMNT
jgi:hypothetical protein